MDQNLKNHRRYVPGYHVILLLLLLIGVVGSIINLYQSVNTPNQFNAALLFVLFLSMVIVFWYVRQFPLKAQDRAILAQENLRYYVLTGKLFPEKLRKSQIIALRFASDEELADLVEAAAAQQLSSAEIKKMIKKWRADHHRL